MTRPPANIHATAIVVDGTGLLFVGPSGIGKSSLAFLCLAAAEPLGLPSALIADDRVLLCAEGETIIAECPPSIAGLMEIRGTGIVRLAHVNRAPMHVAVVPVMPENAERLPAKDERMDLGDGMSLPVIRLFATAPNPLAIVMAKIASGQV